MNKLKQFLTAFQKGMKRFSHNITTVISFFLLSVVYLIGVGITSFLAKLFGKHFLDTKLSKKTTYWSDLNLKKKHIDEYYRQF